jgi:hypothetical protein
MLEASEGTVSEVAESAQDAAGVVGADGGDVETVVAGCGTVVVA